MELRFRGHPLYNYQYYQMLIGLVALMTENHMEAWRLSYIMWVKSNIMEILETNR